MAPTGAVQPIPIRQPDQQDDARGKLALAMAALLARSVYDRPTRPSLQCLWCGQPIPDAKRLNRRYCSESHYKAAWRATKRIDAATTAGRTDEMSTRPARRVMGHG